MTGANTRASLSLRITSEGDRIVVRSPAVGVWSRSVVPGQLIDEHSRIGTLSILGRVHSVHFDSPLAGRVLPRPDNAARLAERAVAWDDVLFEIDTKVAGVSVEASTSVGAGTSEANAVFRSPSSGRFYSRPEPGKPPFVTVGETIKHGDPVCMLEVMKTYSRVRYDGDRARVVAIRPVDQDDLEEGDVVLELEPAT